MTDKLAWMLARPATTSSVEFAEVLLGEYAARLTDLLPDVVVASVILQDEGAFSSTHMDGTAADALLEVTASVPFVALEPWHAFLAESTAKFQGWRLNPTLIFDATGTLAVGEHSQETAVAAFIERIDGTSPEHFDRNWYIHAGHADGRQEESEQSLAERRREEEDSLAKRYEQNRVVEAVTATAWLTHGYSKLHYPFQMPELGDQPYDRPRGEAPFDRWPPRMIQGFEYRVL